MEYKYKFFCSNCCYTTYSNGTNIALKEFRLNPLQKNLPKLDENFKLVESTYSQRIKMFKCPKCGFLIKAKEIKTKEEKEDE